MKRPELNINHVPALSELMTSVQRTIVQQPDYVGGGAHDAQRHGGHGLHEQVSVNMNGTQINFRNILGK